MKLSGRKAVCISLILCSVYLAGLFISSLFFVKEDGIRVAAKHVSHRRLMQGNDDPDSPYIEFLPGQIMDINSADERQLRLLPGVGKKLAEDIIRYRDENGGFSSKEELLNVVGISEAKFDALQEIIVIGEQDEDSGS